MINDRKQTEIIITDSPENISLRTEGNLQLIQAINRIIDKNPEEFVFSCGEWGKHWIKIIYRKGKKIKVKTKDDKK